MHGCAKLKRKKRSKTTLELIDETWEQVENLQTLCQAFKSGRHAIYKNMSVTLRTLLLGSSGDKGLVCAVLPEAKFLPLRLIPISKAAQLITPAEIRIRNDYGGELIYHKGGTMPNLGMEKGGVVLSKHEPVGGAVVEKLTIKNIFNPLEPWKPLEPWLAQPFLNANWTLKSFITRIANKDGGAHVERDEQIEAMAAFGNFHRPLTYLIARYVAAEIALQLHQTYPSHERIER